MIGDSTIESDGHPGGVWLVTNVAVGDVLAIPQVLERRAPILAVVGTRGETANSRVAVLDKVHQIVGCVVNVGDPQRHV